MPRPRLNRLDRSFWTTLHRVWFRDDFGMRCYERASTLLASSRPVEDWGKLLGDAAAVGAMLDRLLRRTKTAAPAG